MTEPLPHYSALPFVVRRGDDVVGVTEIRSTTETIHGLIRLEPDRLVIQWRLYRSTELVGNEIREDREVGPVHEVELPLTAIAAARVRQRWWQWRPRLVLVASDLRAFEGIAGPDGLESPHPGELVLDLRRGDRVAAREFAADVSLAAAGVLARRSHDRLAGNRLDASGARRLTESEIDGL